MRDHKVNKTSWLWWLLVVCFLVLALGPLLWCLILSVTPGNEVLKSTTDLLPSYLSWSNFQELLDPSSRSHEIVFGGIRNSVISSVYTIIIGVPLAVLTAYAFVRYQFRFRTTFLRLFLITIVIPVFTTIIPIFAIFSQFGILDNLFWISVIYVTAFVPVSTWILVNHFKTIPEELWQAAAMDGCNEWRIFWHIIMPVSIPIVITVTLMMLLMSWNQFQIPMMLTSSQHTKVVTLVMSEFMSRTGIDYGMIAASGLLAILPPALVTIIFRRFIVSGLMGGAVKG